MSSLVSGPKNNFRDMIQFNIVPNSSNIASPSALQESPGDGYNGKNIPTPELISSSMNTPDFVNSVNDISNGNTPSSSGTPASGFLTPSGMGFGFSNTPTVGSTGLTHHTSGYPSHTPSHGIPVNNVMSNHYQYNDQQMSHIHSLDSSHHQQDYDYEHSDQRNHLHNGNQYYRQVHPMQPMINQNISPSPTIDKLTSDPKLKPTFFTSSPSANKKSHQSPTEGEGMLHLIEGLADLPSQKYPGGKGNTRNPIPKQVVELDVSKLPKNANKNELLLQCEVLGYDKRVNGMVPIGILSPLQPFEKTADGRFISSYENCILRFSSHSHGQKLALRWTLFLNGKRISSIDSSTFQTITERGIKKQNIRIAERSGSVHSKIGFKAASKLEKKQKMKKWSLSELKIFINALEQYGLQWDKILEVEGLDECRNEHILKKKYKQLLE